LETLTFRSLDYGPPPDEHKVIIGFKAGRALHEVAIPWRVVGIPAPSLARDPQVALKAAWNPAAESVRKAKTLMFAPHAWDAQHTLRPRRLASRRTAPAPDSAPGAALASVVAVGDAIATSLPDVLLAVLEKVGYLRIWRSLSGSLVIVDSRVNRWYCSRSVLDG